jgi:hypothetical protein
VDAISVWVSAAISLVISAGSTYAVIRFSPERRDLQRVRQLLEDGAERERIANEFKCEIEIADMQTKGARVIFTSKSAFQVTQVQLATEAGAPLAMIDHAAPISTRHEVEIPAGEIAKVFFSQSQGVNRTGLLTFRAVVDGHVTERRRAVTVSQLTCANPSGSGMTYYFHLG